MGIGGGLFCCATAAGFYLLACSYKSEKEYLQFITKIEQLKDLFLPLLVAVSGRVGSDTPIKCKHSNSKCVILNERVEQPVRTKCERCDRNKWENKHTGKLVKRAEVPWENSLYKIDDQGDGTGCVHVVGAEGASELDLTFASKIFEAPDESLLDEISNKCFTCKTDLSIKIYPSERMEMVLPMGELLTAIGEAVKDKNGAILIQRPHTGKFYVTQKSIDHLIADLGLYQSIFKCFSVGFAVIGVSLIAEHLIKKVKGRRHRSDLWRRSATERRNLLDMHRSDVSAAARRLEQDNGSLNGRTSYGSEIASDGLARDLCVICEDQEYNIAFVPCGHLCCCRSCSSKLTNCPLCRRRIEQAIRTFRP
ncbi:E3 ubiquitin-protein ligase sp1 [Thalictrum thalictroides]|uniref:RING-type E3 ubiquitin transferase n=1 Tax=Thalictrum thalictroides TaxID=46969 RepID=A0A7J6WH07_THATH|nr:E3 ubiquitin-protein ligase sp1 [Thalictrum thalictroides]